jgi:hypothetical protein
LEDFIIVEKNNVLLIYPKGKEQEIKGIVSQLKILNKAGRYSRFFYSKIRNV